MNESARKRLGKIAKELRKKAKKSQQELADALNIARTDISAFEKRGEKLGLERMETLFDFFGCEITVSEKKLLRRSHNRETTGNYPITVMPL